MIAAQMIDRDVDGRHTLLLRATIGGIVCLLVFAVCTAWGRGVFSDRIQAAALVHDAGGALTVGSDVKSHGVIVGKVTGLDWAEGRVSIGLRLDGEEARRIPADAKARVMPAGVFGTSFVDLVSTGSVGAGRAYLADGAQIPQDTDSKTLELQSTLDSTERVLSAIEPAELASTLAALANALDGQGREIGETIELTNSYLGKLQPQIPLLREDLELGAEVLGTLNAATPDLLDAVKYSSPTLKMIVDERRQLEQTLSRSTRLVKVSDAFIRKYRELIIRAIKETALAFDALFDARAGFPSGFRAFAEFAETATTGLLRGPWLDTDVFIKTGGDEPYTADDCPRFGSAVGDNCPGGR